MSLDTVDSENSYAFNVDDGAVVAELGAKARKILLTTDDPALRGRLANALAISVMLDDMVEGERLLAEAQAALREAGDQAWTSPTVNRTIARAWMAKPLGAELLDAIESSGEFQPARVAAWHAQEAITVSEYDEALRLTADIDSTDPWALDLAMKVKAHALRALGRPSDALALETVVGPPTEQEDANSMYEFGLQFALAHLQLSPPDIDAAETVFYDDYRIDSPLGQAACSWFWGLIAELRGCPEEAALIAGLADRLGGATGYSPMPFDKEILRRSRDGAREQLGDDRYDELYADGQRSSFEEVLKPPSDS